MKKLFLSIALASVSLFALANAPKKKDRKSGYPYAASQSLYQMYGNVENLKWSQAKDEMYRADFQIDGENFSTFFDVNGNFVATTHEISLEQLPATARKALKAKFPVKEIGKIVHYQSNESASYYAEILEEGGATIYSVGSGGEISRFK